MSADNGIYILKTRTKDGGFEYRVANLHAIENLEWDTLKAIYTNDRDIWIKNAREMFKFCKPFDVEVDAFKEAVNWAKDDYTEYGINVIEIDKIF